MPQIPTPEELGGLLHLPGSRPLASYDVTSHGRGLQQIAEAGTRVGQAVEDVGKAAQKVGRQQAMTEAVNANAFIHGRLIEARARYRNDPDHASLAQRWNEEAGNIVEDGLSQISNEGLKEHVRANLAAPLARETAAIQDQAFRGAAAAHAASRDRYLRNLVQHVSLDPNDGLFAGGVDSLHSAIDDAVSRGFLAPDRAVEEKRRSALALCAGQYARMSRVDPTRAIRELESPEDGHPLLAQLPQELKSSLIQQARQQQDDNRKDVEHAALRRLQDSQRASDQAEGEVIADLAGDKPTLTRADISGNQSLSAAAKSRLLAIEDRGSSPDPDAVTSNAAARRLLDRVRLHAGDRNKIATLDPIYRAYIDGDLNKDDFNFVRREFFAKQTPEGDTLLAHKQAFLARIGRMLDRSDPLTGEIDQLGRSKIYLLERDIDRKIDQYRKDGKDPFDLFDRSKPDYVGRPESLQRYAVTLQEFLEERARQLRSTFAPATSTAPPLLPQRRDGETPAEYLGRMNADTTVAREPIPVSR